jgi:hypothetical protein
MNSSINVIRKRNILDLNIWKEKVHLLASSGQNKKDKKRENTKFLSTCVSKVLAEGLYSRVILAILGPIPQENKCER